MNVLRLIFPSILVLLVVWSTSVTSGIKQDAQRNFKDHTQTKGQPAKRAYGAHVDGFAIALGVAALITGIGCTELGACSTDVITQKIDALSSKVDSIQSQITTLQKEVAEIRQEVHMKWYLDLIDYVTSQMTKISAEALLQSANRQDVALRDKFVDQNLGIHRDDYVYKGLFMIPALVTSDSIVEHYLNHQRDLDEANAVDRTCNFAKEILEYQDNGYTVLIVSFALKFEDDLPAYNEALAEVCALWRAGWSAKLREECSRLQDELPEEYEDRRQPQINHILGIKGLENCSLNRPTPNSSAS